MTSSIGTGRISTFISSSTKPQQQPAMRASPSTIEAHQKHLFDPLHITRIRRAKDLVTDQEPGGARYLDPAIVPTDYGTLHLEILDSDGGLTAAVTDMARLLAIVLSPGQ